MPTSHANGSNLVEEFSSGHEGGHAFGKLSVANR